METARRQSKGSLEHALRVLEFNAVLLRLSEFCETPIAREASLHVRPVFEADEVWVALLETHEAYELLANDPPPSLNGVADLRHELNRCSKGGQLEGRELYDIGVCLSAQRRLKSYLNGKPGAERLQRFVYELAEAPKVEERLFASLDSGGEVLDTASQALGQLRAKKSSAAGRIVSRIQSYVSGKTRDLLSDAVYTVRDGRYVLPLKAENRGKIRGLVHDTSATGSTIYVEPEDVLELGNALREVEAAERAEVKRILAELSQRVAGVAKEAGAGLEAACAFDLIVSKARLGYAMRGRMPSKLATAGIRLEGAKHPLLDIEKAVPLTIEVGVGQSVLITGPNTGGKTVAIKTVGLGVAMLHAGMFAGSHESALGPFSGLWADIGDEQSLEQSLSTFSGHVKNIALALSEMRSDALILFDEIGAGTDPAEGAALAIAILRTMADAGCAILASTHFGELKQFAYETPGFSNAAMEFDVKTLAPTYRLIVGAPGASQALRIAERLGLPKSIIELAKEGLGSQAASLSTMMEELERAQRQARKAQGDADRRAAELQAAQEAADKKLAEIEEIRTTIRRRAADSIDNALREMRLEAHRIFDELKKNPVGVQAAKKDLEALESLVAEAGREFGERDKPAKAANPSALAKGMTVRVQGYQQKGVLLSDPSGKTVQVQMGVIKMNVPITQVFPDAPEPVARKKPAQNIGFSKAQTASTEIHLRMMRAEIAEEELEKFLDEATLAGLPSVRIVHGKGEGILRRLTRDILRKHPHVKSYRDGDAGEGGQGVTVAVLG